jgi:hypothetical protein
MPVQELMLRALPPFALTDASGSRSKDSLPTQDVYYRGWSR